MIRKTRAFALALSLAATACFTAFPMYAMASEPQSVETAEQSETDAAQEELEVAGSAELDIEGENVTEGLEDFEVPMEDQLNPAISDSHGDGDGETPDPGPEYSDPPEESYTPEPEESTPPIQRPARTGEATPLLAIIGIGALSVAGVALTLRKGKQS